MRHAKSEYLKPVFRKTSRKISIRRKQQYDRSKIAFAKMGNTTEAFFDADGDYAGLNMNFAFVDDDDEGKFLTAYVNSAIGSWIYRQLFGALAMSGGYLQYQSPQIREWPVPKYDSRKTVHVAVVQTYERFLRGECDRQTLDRMVEKCVSDSRRK